MSEGIQFAGEVRLSTCNLISAAGGSKGVNITPMVYEINVYEDLFSNVISGAVVLVDCLNLVLGLPIIGEEILELEFKTPTFDQTFKKSLFVYKMSNRIVGGDKKNAYVLHFTSIETVNDLNTRINRAYSGFTHEIVESIYTEYIKSDSSTKKIHIEESSNKIKYVSNWWSPFKNINYLASKSIDATSFSTPNYLFFEGRKSFYFMSLNKLFDYEPKGSYIYDMQGKRDKPSQDSGESTRDIHREYFSAYEMYIDESFDYIARMMSGSYSNKVIQPNIMNKTIGSHVYNYWYDFDKTKHMGNKQICSPNVTFDDDGVIISTKMIYPEAHNGLRDIGAEIAAKRLPLLSHTDLYKIKITVPGRTDLEVGDIVNFKMGDYGKIDASDASSGDKYVDKYYGGKYLITGILHQVTQREHQMTLSLSKDAIESKDGFEFGKVIS